MAGLWCGESALKSQFPNLYRMARFKDGAVDQMFSRNGEHIHWDLYLLGEGLMIGRKRMCEIFLPYLLRGSWFGLLILKGHLILRVFVRPFMIGLCVLVFLRRLSGGQKLLQKPFFCLGCRLRKSSNGGLFEEKKFPWA